MEASETPVQETEISRLRHEVSILKQENQDLRTMLSTTTEHGDMSETALYETTVKLRDEVTERLKTEATLKALIDLLVREKHDLEIIVQTIMEHGDVLDAQWWQQIQALMRLANLDELTQVANRRQFDGHLAQQWQQSVRDRTSIAVLMCDIDHFKEYNDAQGHLAGDGVLKQVAQTLNQGMTHPLDLLARYGGEEFAVILPQMQEPDALVVAQRLQTAIADLRIPHPRSPIAEHLTLSIGLACCCPQALASPNDLVHSADQMLYLAKQQGRNRIVPHSIVCQER